MQENINCELTYGVKCNIVLEIDWEPHNSRRMDHWQQVALTRSRILQVRNDTCFRQCTRAEGIVSIAMSLCGPRTRKQPLAVLYDLVDRSPLRRRRHEIGMPALRDGSIPHFHCFI